MLTKEQVEVKLRRAKVCRLEERVHATEENSNGLRVSHARVGELEAVLASLTAGTAYEMAGRDTLGARIRELQMATATRYRLVGRMLLVV